MRLLSWLELNLVRILIVAAGLLALACGSAAQTSAPRAPAEEPGAGRLTPADLDRLADEERRDERARFGTDSHRLTITIPGNIRPSERLERFEEPLQDALGELGEVQGSAEGGGTSSFSSSLATTFLVVQPRGEGASTALPGD